MIRLAEQIDLQGILDIYNDAIIHTTAIYSYKPHTLDMRQAWFQQKLEDGYPVFVYEWDGQVAGFATYGPFRPWPAFKYSIEHSIYVGKHFRKKGIATSLMKHLINDATEKEYKTMIGGIDADNLQSIAMHEKFGFVHAGTIQKAGYKFGRWLNLAFYQLELEGPRKPVEE